MSKYSKNMRRGMAKNKTKKMYIMTGCSKPNSKCKTFFPKKLNKSKKVNKYQTGGFGCSSSCSPQTGGSFYKPAKKIPGSTVGSPWTANNWPGSTDLIGNNGYFSLNEYLDDPQTSMKSSSYYLGGSALKGGYVYKKNKSDNFNKSNSNKTNSNKTNSNKTESLTKQGGGGLMPQDLVNLGRGFMYNIGSAYNALNGYSAPVNPLPYKDQYTSPQSLRNFKI
jgi:hypothetical protein